MQYNSAVVIKQLQSYNYPHGDGRKGENILGFCFLKMLQIMNRPASPAIMWKMFLHGMYLQLYYFISSDMGCPKSSPLCPLSSPYLSPNISLPHWYGCDWHLASKENYQVCNIVHQYKYRL